MCHNAQRRQWLLPGKSHGWRSLVGCSAWDHKASDTTEWLNFHCSLSWLGEGNGNPLQCSCLENPRDGGAWWAAVYGVARSRTRLKRLSSSSSSHNAKIHNDNERLFVVVVCENIELLRINSEHAAFIYLIIYLFYSLEKLYHENTIS